MNRVLQWRSLWIVGIVAALLLGCSSPAEQKAERMAAAEQYLAEGNLREAVIELRGALKLDPRSPEINAKIAEVLERVGDLTNAVFFREEAHRLAPDSEEYALSLAKLTLFEDPERARELIDEVIARNPQSVMARVRLSEYALSQGDSAGALEAALVAVELGRDDVLARLQLGLVHRARTRELQLTGGEVPKSVFQEAFAAFEEAIAIAEKRGDVPIEVRHRAWVERANVLATWPARHAEAAGAYREAAEAVRESRDHELSTLQSAADFLRSYEDPEMRRWILERRVELDPARIESWIALAALVDGRDAERSTILERLIAERPDDANAQARYIRDLVRRAGPEAAAAHADAVAGQTGSPERVWAEVVRIHVVRGNVDAADELAKRLITEYPDSFEVDIVRGEVALAAGRYEEAVVALAQGLERRESVEGYAMLATAQRSQGDNVKALTSIDRALELAGVPEPIGVLRQKAQIQQALGSHQAAVATYARIRRRLRDRLPVSDTLSFARSLYAIGRAPNARRMLDAVLRTDAPPPEAALLFARMEGRRDPDRARKLLAEAAARDPANPEIAAALARFDIGAGDLDSALELLSAGIEKDPENLRLRLVRARLYASKGMLEEATEDARVAFEQAPDRRGPAELLVQLLAAQNKRDEAVASLEAKRKDGKLETSGRVLLGRLYLSAGDQERAIELLESALAERDDLPGVKNDLAYLLAERGTGLERALQLAQEAREGLPRNPQTADTLGYVYLKRDLPQPAIAQFREALEMIESSHASWPTIQYHMGLALRATGQDEQAVEAFEKALAAAVEFPDQEATRKELESLRAARGDAG